ncbi:unnamed protein product [Ixodes persulcatus]
MKNSLHVQLYDRRMHVSGMLDCRGGQITIVFTSLILNNSTEMLKSYLMCAKYN